MSFDIILEVVIFWLLLMIVLLKPKEGTRTTPAASQYRIRFSLPEWLLRTFGFTFFIIIIFILGFMVLSTYFNLTLPI